MAPKKNRNKHKVAAPTSSAAGTGGGSTSITATGDDIVNVGAGGGGSEADHARDSLEHVCVRCLLPAKNFCGKCKSVWYCGAVCQTKDWKLGHNLRCGKTVQHQQALALAAATDSAAAATTAPTATPTAAAAGDTKSAPTDGTSGSGGAALTLPDGSPLPPLAPPATLPLPTLYLTDPNTLIPLFNAKQMPLERSGGGPPPGLTNVGNTCFGNALLQCLTHTLPLWNYTSVKGHAANCRVQQKARDTKTDASAPPPPTASPTDKKIPAAGSGGSGGSGGGEFCLFCLVEQHITTAQTTKEKAYAPTAIMSEMKRISANFIFGAQEDAHEFGRGILRGIEDACLNHCLPPSVTNRKQLSLRTQETTFVHWLFGGYLLSQVTCPQCGQIQNNYENFLDLSLEISDATDSLHEMLESFTAPERLDKGNKYRCGRCKQNVRAEKRLTIYEAPNILLIHLKRFRVGMYGKINKPITYKSELSLRPFMSPSQLRAGVSVPVYRLYAVLVHLDVKGSSNFGHYIAYVRTSNNKWYKCDDSTVTETTLEAVLALNAYLLWYERIAPSLTAAAGVKIPGQPEAKKPPTGKDDAETKRLLSQALALSIEEDAIRAAGGSVALGPTPTPAAAATTTGTGSGGQTTPAAAAAALTPLTRQPSADPVPTSAAPPTPKLSAREQEVLNELLDPFPTTNQQFAVFLLKAKKWDSTAAAAVLTDDKQLAKFQAQWNEEVRKANPNAPPPASPVSAAGGTPKSTEPFVPGPCKTPKCDFFT